MFRRLREEIQQQMPFESLEQEAVLNVLRTADVLLQRITAVLKPFKLSPSQYNVLRILRGAGPEGLACREIGERMITSDPEITRLLDRLEARGLLTRTRDQKDRRVITALRHERATRRGHHMLAHLRTEAYPIYAKYVYPPASEAYAARHRLSYDLNNRRIDAMKHQGEVSYAD
jgi:DNA-binding MarR family transcriptional regulator